MISAFEYRYWYMYSLWFKNKQSKLVSYVRVVSYWYKYKLVTTPFTCAFTHMHHTHTHINSQAKETQIF
jgi:hypothetical protein